MDQETLDYYRLYELRNLWQQCQADFKEEEFLTFYGKEIMKEFPYLLSQSLKWENTRDTLTHLIARFGPPFAERGKEEFAANIRLLFALDELAIPGYGINFQVWKEGKVYQAPPDMVTGVIETLLAKMEEISPAARHAMEAYGREEQLIAEIERLRSLLPKEGKQ